MSQKSVNSGSDPASSRGEREKSNMWIILTLIGGLSYALGNVSFGINLSQLGIWGTAFIGPITFAILGLYRFVELCLNKRRIGTWIDKENSNYWSKTEGDEYQRVENETVRYRFNWSNLRLVFFTQACQSIGGFIMVAYAFKFAKMAEINQGSIPSLFTITSIYISIVFYFKFNEMISCSQIVGIGLMIPCVFLISCAAKTAEVSDSDYTADEMRIYGLYAILCALLAPIFWTLRSVYTRQAIDTGVFPVFDLSIDSLIYSSIFQNILFAIYLVNNPFKWNEFIEGQITGVFFFIGMICTMTAFKSGPGGPINSLLCTQIVYQTLINAVFFDQGVSSYEIGGASCGILATMMITLWDPCFKSAAIDKKVTE